MFEDSEDHLATGGESLAEFARNAGQDHPERAWLLDGRDVWVANPFYVGPPVPHPESDDPAFGIIACNATNEQCFRCKRIIPRHSVCPCLSGSQHLDEGITPEPQMDAITAAAHAYSIGAGEIPF